MMCAGRWKEHGTTKIPVDWEMKMMLYIVGEIV